MRWGHEFSKGRTDVHDEQRSSRPSLSSNDLLQETEGEIRANRCMMIRELHHIIPKVSKTTIYEAVTEKLGYRKLCSMTTRGPIPHTSPLRFWKNSSGIYWTIRCTVWTSCPAISTRFFT